MKKDNLKKTDLLKCLKSKNTIFFFLISIIILYILAIRIDIKKTVSIINSANIWYFALAFFIFYASILIRGYRWKILLENVNIKGKLIDITEICYLAIFVNSILPAKLGEIYRGHLIRKKYKARITRVIGTIIVERLADIIFLILIVTISGFMIFGKLIPENILISIKYGYMLLLIALLSFVFLKHHSRWIVSFLPIKFETAIKELKYGILKSVSLNELHMLGLLTIIIWTGEILRMYFVIIALNLNIPFYVIAFTALLSSLVSSIPLTPGGLGIVELAVIEVLMFLGYGINISASVAILDRIINYGSILFFGSIVYWISNLNNKHTAI